MTRTFSYYSIRSDTILGIIFGMFSSSKETRSSDFCNNPFNQQKISPIPESQERINELT